MTKKGIWILILALAALLFPAGGPRLRAQGQIDVPPPACIGTDFPAGKPSAALSGNMQKYSETASKTCKGVASERVIKDGLKALSMFNQIIGWAITVATLLFIILVRRKK